MRKLFILALLLTLSGCGSDHGHNPPPDDPFPPTWNNPPYPPPPYIPPVPLPPVHKHGTDAAAVKDPDGRFQTFF